MLTTGWVSQAGCPPDGRVILLSRDIGDRMPKSRPSGIWRPRTGYRCPAPDHARLRRPRRTSQAAAAAPAAAASRAADPAIQPLRAASSCLARWSASAATAGLAAAGLLPAVLVPMPAPRPCSTPLALPAWPAANRPGQAAGQTGV